MPLIARPLLGTPGAKIMSVGGRLHAVPNEVVFARLKEDIYYATEGQPWIAAIGLANGDVVLAPSDQRLPWPRQDQIDKILDVIRIAHADAGFGGHWVLAWAGGELHAVWRDADGDAHVTNTFPEAWDRMATVHAADMAETLHNVWHAARQHQRNAGIRPEHMIRRALGEKPTRH